METNSQLIKKIKEGGYNNVYPIAYIDGIIDKESNEKLSDILIRYNNIMVPWQGDVASTRNRVPSLMRRQGIVITYITDLSEIVTEVYKGTVEDIKNNWADNINWELVPDLKFVQDNASKLPDGTITPEKLSPALQELISQSGSIVNMPDDEDLEQKDMVLKFKDRPYNSELANGNGYKILRKNWTNVGTKTINLLTQDVFNQSNTIYEIRYDFDLGGETITLPNNCTLKFEGGSLKNGNIIFNKTYLEGNVKLLEGNYSGFIINNRVSVEWFGMERGSNADYSSLLQKIVDFASTDGNSFEIYFPYEYYINNTVYLPGGTKFVGYSGHTFKLGGRLNTSVQTDDFVMFKGKRGSDIASVRHCIMEGMTFARNRTAEERASGLGNGEGYGQAGICFSDCTEMDFNDCGFIGFGTCISSSDIIFCNSTDFAYCNNIIKSSQSGGGCSSNFISLSNIWCCGNLTETDSNGLQNIVFSDTWIEYCQTLLKSTLGTKIPSLIFQNCEISNTGYENPSLLEFNGTTNPNTPTIRFDKCTIRCKKQLCISENPATTVFVELNNCEFLYGGDISLETCNFYGNSKVKSLSNDYITNGKIDYLGLNTQNGEIGNTIKFLRKYGYPEHTYLGAWQIFRDAQNRLAFHDEKSHYCVIPSFIEVEGDTPTYTIDDVNSPYLFVYNRNPNPNQAILTFYNFVTGVKRVLIENYNSYGNSDNRPSVIRGGVMYFDTTLNKPIWAKRDQYGVVTWVDATGAEV